jgi:hypothetical protein
MAPSAMRLIRALIPNLIDGTRSGKIEETQDPGSRHGGQAHTEPGAPAEETQDSPFRKRSERIGHRPA